MLSKIRQFITPPIAAVLIAGGLIFAALLVFAPPDVRTALLSTSGMLLGANGLVWTFVAAQLQPGKPAPISSADADGPPTRNLRPPPMLTLMLVFVLLALATGCGPTMAESAKLHHDESALGVRNRAAIMQRCGDEHLSYEACSTLIEAERARNAAALRTICRANLRARDVCR